MLDRIREWRWILMVLLPRLQQSFHAKARQHFLNRSVAESVTQGIEATYRARVTRRVVRDDLTQEQATTVYSGFERLSFL